MDSERSEELHADVVIVGGGIIGATFALGLARRDLDVVIVDPAPGDGATWGNAGLIVPSYSTPMSTPANLWDGLRSVGSNSGSLQLVRPLPLSLLVWLGAFALQCRPLRARRAAERLTGMAQRSRVLYDELIASGVDLQLDTTGWLWAYRSTAALDATGRHITGLGVRCEQLDASGLGAIESKLGDDLAGGIWFPDESTLEPASTSAAILHAAVARGARIVRETVVETRRYQRTTGAVVTTGPIIHATAFVIASGAESRAVAKKFGAQVPVQPGYGWSLTFPWVRESASPALMSADDHAVISRCRSHLRITGGMQFGGRVGAPPTQHALDELRSSATRLLPEIAELPDGIPWMGARPMTTSGLPVSRQLRGSTNVFASTGHGPLGVTLAPVAAESLIPSILSALG